MTIKDQATKDGYDIQMQTNCLSHFLLTKELFPLLKNSHESRIVNHTSMARIGEPLYMKYCGKNSGNLGGDGTDEDGALGIIRACMDKDAESGHFYGPKEWTGFPKLLPPAGLLLDPKNIQINWEGCETAVGEFVF